MISHFLRNWPPCAAARCLQECLLAHYSLLELTQTRGMTLVLNRVSSCWLAEPCPFCCGYLCKPAVKAAVTRDCTSLCNLISFLKLQFLYFLLIFHINPEICNIPLSRAKLLPWYQLWRAESSFVLSQGCWAEFFPGCPLLCSGQSVSCYSLLLLYLNGKQLLGISSWV